MSRQEIQVHALNLSLNSRCRIDFNLRDPATAKLIVVTGQEPSTVTDQLCLFCQARRNCYPVEVPINLENGQVNGLLCKPITGRPRICVIKSSL